ncbi:MAG: hypothetical protein V3R85_10235 [Alphaproteobacteria bacterium]
MSRAAYLSTISFLSLLTLATATGATATAAPRAPYPDGTPLNPRLLSLPTGIWTEIHQQKPNDKVRFRRQPHGGSAFDTRRGRLVLFGSDTHGKNWANSPLFFDLASLEWKRLYPNDHRGTYRVNDNGVPVAGRDGVHPWAMHSFGAVEYDPARDEIIVSSHPGHMVPGRFTNAVAGLWGLIRHHPTWILSLETGRWTPLPRKSVSFFPYATAFDTDRGVVIGYRNNGIYELGGKTRSWRRVKKKGLFGWHNNAVYDSRHKALVVFGTNRNSNAIVVYRPDTGEHQMMRTPRPRPPRDQHAPMAYHPIIDRTVVLVDFKPSWLKQPYWTTHTWLYDLGKDAWTPAKSALLPFPAGMNYNMAYDPGHELLLLVANRPNRPTTVWALRLKR